MAKTKSTAGLAQPVEPSKWARIRQAERVSYATAQPIRTNWQTAGTYTCPELQHRSSRNQPPSIVLGQRVSRDAGR